MTSAQKRKVKQTGCDIRFDPDATHAEYYFAATGVSWLAINCQPAGPFTQTFTLWYWPLACLPLY
jgi:hypothetical protein